MNVSLKNNDELSALVSVEIGKEDYAESVDKKLRDLRKRVDMPGFRKGMVPLGLVKKMYGKSVLVEEVQKNVFDGLFNYLRENDVQILAEPMPNESEQKEIDFDTQDTFEFVFDVALAPTIEITLNKRDKLTFYKVNIDDEMLDKQVGAYVKNYGTYDPVDTVEAEDMVKGRLTELENGEPKENGMIIEDAVLMPFYLKNEEEKAKLVGAKVNTTVVFNPYTGYDGHEAELASFLKTTKEEVANHQGDFRFEITESTRHKDAEMNQEFFDRVFEPGAVTTPEAFREEVRKTLENQFTPQGDYKMLMDARKMMLKKAGDVAMADDLVKRWLKIANENTTEEQIEADYANVKDDIVFQLIQKDLEKKNDLAVNEADIDGTAKRIARAQFAQYGMMTVPDDMLENYSKDMLKNQDTYRNIVDRAFEEKLLSWLKEKVKIEEKEVSYEEFEKLLNPAAEEQK